jgi:hypothetical protein
LEGRALDDYATWLNLAHDFGAKDGDDMRQVVSDGIARLEEQNAALGTRVGQFQFCIDRVAEALGNVCCSGVDSSPKDQLADPHSTTRVLCDAIRSLQMSQEAAADTLRDAGKAAKIFNQHALSELFAIAENYVRATQEKYHG